MSSITNQHLSISSLLTAIQQNDFNLVIELLSTGIDTKCIDQYGHAILRYCFNSNCVEIFELLVSCNYIDLQSFSVECDMLTPVAYLCKTGNILMLRSLLQFDEFYDHLRTNDGPYTIMGPELIYPTLTHVPNPMGKGQSLYQLALQAPIHNNYELIQLLVENDFKFNSSDYQSYTPLMRACLLGDINSFHCLIYNGAQDRFEEGLQELAFQGGSMKMVELLSYLCTNSKEYTESIQNIRQKYEYGFNEIILNEINSFCQTKMNQIQSKLNNNLYLLDKKLSHFDLLIIQKQLQVYHQQSHHFIMQPINTFFLQQLPLTSTQSNQKLCHYITKMSKDVVIAHCHRNDTEAGTSHNCQSFCIPCAIHYNGLVAVYHIVQLYNEFINTNNNISSQQFSIPTTSPLYQLFTTLTSHSQFNFMHLIAYYITHDDSILNQAISIISKITTPTSILPNLEYGSTIKPIQIAIIRHNYKVVQLLLRHKVNVQITTSETISNFYLPKPNNPCLIALQQDIPLIALAALSNSTQIMELLLQQHNEANEQITTNSPNNVESFPIPPSNIISQLKCAIKVAIGHDLVHILEFITTLSNPHYTILLDPKYHLNSISDEIDTIIPPIHNNRLIQSTSNDNINVILHHAVRSRATQCLTYLLSVCLFPIDMVNPQNQFTPLLEAIMRDDIEFMGRLLFLKANPHYTPQSWASKNILHVLASENDTSPAILSYIMSLMPSSVNAVDTDNSYTPLCYATHYQYITKFAILQSQDANINIRTTNGSTLLHIIAQSKYYDRSFTTMVIGLMSQPDVIDSIDNDGYTPLLLATKHGHEKFVELLLLSKANPKAIVEGTNETFLDLAMKSNNDALMAMALKFDEIFKQ